MVYIFEKTIVQGYLLNVAQLYKVSFFTENSCCSIFDPWNRNRDLNWDWVVLSEESWLLTGERASEVIRLSGGDFSGHEPCYATAPPPFSSSHCSLTHVWRTKIEDVALGCVSLSPKKTSLFHCIRPPLILRRQLIWLPADRLHMESLMMSR